MPMVALNTFSNDIQRLMYDLTRYYAICDQVFVREIGVTAAQGYILLALPDTESVTMNELSNRMKLANSTMTRMVDQLIRKALLAREPDPEDRRIVRVRLTAQGRDVKDKLQQAMHDFFAQIFQDIPEGERPQIIHNLEVLKQSIVNTLQSCCGAELGE